MSFSYQNSIDDRKSLEWRYDKPNHYIGPSYKDCPTSAVIARPIDTELYRQFIDKPSFPGNPHPIY